MCSAVPATKFERAMYSSLAMLLLQSVEVAAAEPLRNRCDHAAEVAANDQDVPLDVMLAITRVETGRSVEGEMQPWPWAIHVAGQGHWFDSRIAASTFIEKLQSAGYSNFDVGCFQINYRWHSDGFASVAEMLDPLKNARYAAKFIKRQFQQNGNWSQAAGAYHSKTSKLAKPYRAKFDKARAAVSGQKFAKINRTVEQNRSLPLLQNGQHRLRLGSLLGEPHAARARPSLGSTARLTN